jgi:hypothetical protein
VLIAVSVSAVSWILLGIESLTRSSSRSRSSPARIDVDSIQSKYMTISQSIDVPGRGWPANKSFKRVVVDGGGST